MERGVCMGIAALNRMDIQWYRRSLGIGQYLAPIQNLEAEKSYDREREDSY